MSAELLLVDLVQLAVVAAVLLLLLWLGRVWWRETMLRQVTSRFPEQAAEIRQKARKVPLLLGPRPPKDPYARTCRTVVPPRGDGRPGESFWGPAPGRLTDGHVGPDGSRQDADVLVAPGTYVLVVCLGRLGARWDDHVVVPAAERVERQRATTEAPAVVSGPVDRVPTGAGPGWRTTIAYPGGRMLTDTHVDRDGWAFVVGVLSSSWHTRAVEVVDGILATWQWITHGEHADR